MSLRSALTNRLVRRYLRRLQNKRSILDPASLAALPEAALLPLRRDGVDPLPAMDELRGRAPVSRLPIPGVRVWLVSGHEEARQVLSDVKSFSNEFTNLAAAAGLDADHQPGGLGFRDPPDHTRLRRLLTPEFTMRRLNRIQPRIHEIVAEQLTRLSEAADTTGVVDFVEHFATPVPTFVICELLGVPYEERGAFQEFSASRFDVLGGISGSFGAISHSHDYLGGVIARQRDKPGEGLLGGIIRDHGDEIDDEELIGLADGVLTGGLESSASMLALGTLVLLRDREHFEALRDAADPGPVAAALVEELLRHLSVVQTAFPRFARADTEVGDVTIGKGDIVVVSLNAANRDARLGPDMNAFDPSRTPSSPHLAFGYGIHRCVGAELARVELRAAFPDLAARYPNLRLATDPEKLEFRKLSIVHGVTELPVQLN